MDLKGAQILVTGTNDLLGACVKELLTQQGAVVHAATKSSGYDMRNEAEVFAAILTARPDTVVHLASAHDQVGSRAFRDNLLTGINIIHATAVARCRLILGVPCSHAYDRPLAGESFWEGYPEPLENSYGVAKKTLHVMCELYRKQHGLDFVYLVLSNLYGPFDSFRGDLLHFIPSMIAQIMKANNSGLDKTSLFAVGSPDTVRSFLHVRDAAEAIGCACSRVEHEDRILNITGSEDTSSKDLASMVARLCDYKGELAFDEPSDLLPKYFVPSRGGVKKLLEWTPQVPLETGLGEMIQRFKEDKAPVSA